MNDLRIDNIKRKKQVTVIVNGKEITAYEGETLLAALLASGIKTMKKSAVYHEPRGALCGMGVCFECAVTVNGVPNTRACMTEVENKMEVEIDER